MTWTLIQKNNVWKIPKSGGGKVHTVPRSSEKPKKEKFKEIHTEKNYNQTVKSKSSDYFESTRKGNLSCTKEPHNTRSGFLSRNLTSQKGVG